MALYYMISGKGRLDRLSYPEYGDPDSGAQRYYVVYGDVTVVPLHNPGTDKVPPVSTDSSGAKIQIVFNCTIIVPKSLFGK